MLWNMEANEVIKELRRRVKATNQRQAALALDMTPQFINDVLKGRRGMTEELAKRLGYIRVVNYIKIAR
jgi:plasmid maintenance system antidote protein VapI